MRPGLVLTLLLFLSTFTFFMLLSEVVDVAPKYESHCAHHICGIQKQWSTMEYYGIPWNIKHLKPASKMRNGQSPCQTKKD